MGDPPPSKPLSAPNPVYAYAHTHWDREWYRTFGEFRLRLVKVIDEVLEQLESGKLPAFNLDAQSIVLEDYLALRPENAERLKKLIATDKLSVGPWYVQPDEHLISGESLVRNLQYGVGLAKAFGENSFTGYLPDNFGHAADTPMVLNQMGIRTAMLWRGASPEQAWVKWQSPSGDSVLTYYMPEGYPQAKFLMAHRTLAEKRDNLKEWLGNVLPFVEESQPIVYPLGCDHLGASDEAVRHLQEVMPQVEITTADQFMNQAADEMDQSRLQTLHGELRQSNPAVFLLPGVFSSRMPLKQANRKLEWRLTRELEQLMVWQQMRGQNPRFRHELDHLWKTLLQNHAHDSICGCSVDEVHRENEFRFQNIDRESRILVEEAWQNLRRELQPHGSALLVNLSDRPYTGVVELEAHYPYQNGAMPPQLDNSQVIELAEGAHRNPFLDTLSFPNPGGLALNRKTLVWAENIPPHGVMRLERPGIPRTMVYVEGDRKLRNGRVELEVHPNTGDISVRDLETGEVYKGLHQLWRNPENGDGYNAAPLLGAQREKARLIACQPVMQGPLRSELRLTYYFPSINLPVETFVSLDAATSQVRFRTHLTNNTGDHKIQAAFETGDPLKEVVAEGHFAPVVRKYDPDYRIEEHMPAKGRELPVNSGVIQRFVGFNDQTLVTEGLTEYEVEGSQLKLTLLRAFGYMSRGDTWVRGGSGALPGGATPDAQLIGRPLEFEYAWAPGFDISEAYQQADRLYGAVYGFDRQAKRAEASASGAEKLPPTESFFSWDNPVVQASAITPVAEGVWHLRLFNPGATPQTVRLRFQNEALTVQPVTLAGQRGEELKEPVLELAPYRLQTLEVRMSR